MKYLNKGLFFLLGIIIILVNVMTLVRYNSAMNADNGNNDTYYSIPIDEDNDFSLGGLTASLVEYRQIDLEYTYSGYVYEIDPLETYDTYQVDEFNSSLQAGDFVIGGAVLGQFEENNVINEHRGIVILIDEDEVIIQNYDNLLVKISVDQNTFYQHDFENDDLEFTLELSSDIKINLELVHVDYQNGFVNNTIEVVFALDNTTESVFPNMSSTVKVKYGEVEGYTLESSAFYRDGIYVLQTENMYVDFIKEIEIDSVKSYVIIPVLSLKQYGEYVIIEYDDIQDGDILYERQ